MAKFKFRLQGYLNVKEKIEEQKKLEYGKAVRRVEDEKEKKRLIEKEALDCIEILRDGMGKGMRPDEFIRSKQYIVHLEKQAIKQIGVIKKAEEFAESKRTELLAAVKHRKMVDVLKENDYSEYLIEEKKSEQKIVDEIVSYRYGNSEK